MLFRSKLLWNQETLKFAIKSNQEPKFNQKLHPTEYNRKDTKSSISATIKSQISV